MSDYDLADQFRREAELRARAPFLNLKRPLAAAPEVVILLDPNGRVLRHSALHPGVNLAELVLDGGIDVHSAFHPDCDGKRCDFVANWNKAWQALGPGRPVEWLHLSSASNIVLKLRLQPVAYACRILFDSSIDSYEDCYVLFVQDLTRPDDRIAETANDVRIKNAVIYEKRRATDADPDLIASIDDRLRTVTRHLLDARDAVRRRLAADLHDGLGQTLGMLRLEIESAVARLSPGDDTAVLDLAVERVKQAQNELRQYTKRLHSQVTDSSGLVDSLQALAADFRLANCDIELTVDLKGFRRDVPAELSVAIYRIVQESLNNIIHHSGARNASLLLQSDEKTGVQLVVSDDGVGLPTSGPAHRGLGLVTMRERAERLGGHYETDCPNNEGCTIRVSWRPELVASLR